MLKPVLSLRKILIGLLWSWAAWLIPVTLIAYVMSGVPGSNPQVALENRSLLQLILVVTVILGTAHQAANWLTDIPAIRKQSMAVVFLLRFSIFAAVVVVWVLLDIGRIADSELDLSTEGTIQNLSWLGMIMLLWYVDTVYSWLYQLRTLAGRRTFRNLLIGKYRVPRTEKKIFMFIDMKDSTTHAEQLGHVRFAELIQECFKVFGTLASNRDVDIYQYVGDEVIVSWYEDEGLHHLNCIRLFVDFRNSVIARADEFRKRFGLVPSFKAGAHIGEVTVAEIGVAKRGIEYLSDVLNTAARIQGECNRYGTDFLVSGTLYELLGEDSESMGEFVDNTVLKGKQEAVDLYRITLS